MTASFDERWGIKTNLTDNIRKFHNRLIVVFGEELAAKEDNLKQAAFHLGVPLSEVGREDDYYPYNWHVRLGYLTDSYDLPVLAKNLEALMTDKVLSTKSSDFIAKLVNDSMLGIRFANIKGDWVSYPEGEKLLDVEVVERPLSYLGEKSSLEFVKALEYFSEGKWDTSVEKTRRTLEEYLKEKLGNGKGMAFNIVVLVGVLKQNDMPDHLRNMLQKYLKLLDEYYNNASKHHTKVTGTAENEFLIYAVGVIINILGKTDINTAKETIDADDTST